MIKHILSRLLFCIILMIAVLVTTTLDTATGIGKAFDIIIIFGIAVIIFIGGFIIDTFLLNKKQQKNKVNTNLILFAIISTLIILFIDKLFYALS